MLGSGHARQAARQGLQVHVRLQLGQPRRDDGPQAAHVVRQSGAPFAMECAQRTEADKKGGHLASRGGGRPAAARVGAVPRRGREEVPGRRTKHKFFNTNNLWIDLQALKAAFDKFGGVLPLPVIKNGKTVDPRDKASHQGAAARDGDGRAPSSASTARRRSSSRARASRRSRRRTTCSRSCPTRTRCDRGLLRGSVKCDFEWTRENEVSTPVIYPREHPPLTRAAPPPPYRM